MSQDYSLAHVNALIGLTVEAQRMLAQAEDIYGPRDTSWTFRQVDFHPDGPHTWFPSPSENTVDIHIMSEAAFDVDRRQYQLAHEVIHLLTPHRVLRATMLEEGLAVRFSLLEQQFPNRDYKDRAMHHMQSNAGAAIYKTAFDLVAELIAARPDGVAKLRRIRPNFYEMTPQFIYETLDISKDLASKLCERTKMRD